MRSSPRWMASALECLGAVLIAVCCTSAFAQKYPTKPIRMIAPFPPGGGTDILSRLLAVPLSQTFGQSVIVDNRSGAGGAIGAEIAARAEPDGHTLILVSASYCATSAYQKLAYDPVNDIQAIILLGTTGLVMTVHPSVQAASVKEFIAHARANPGKINYASVGVGSVGHLAQELFKQMAKVNLVHVPYKGRRPGVRRRDRGGIADDFGQRRADACRICAPAGCGQSASRRPTRSPLLPDVADDCRNRARIRSDALVRDLGAERHAPATSSSAGTRKSRK